MSRGVHSSLISACEKGQQPRQALEVFQAMQRKGPGPGAAAWHALISACEKGKQPKPAVEVSQAMQ